MDKKSIKSSIMERIDQLQQELIDLNEEAKPIAPENAIGRISRMDAINNKSVVEASIRTKEQTLRSLKAAANRVDDADFGICATCGKPIPEGRILLIPHARKCVTCS